MRSAEELIERSGAISVQVLNEFTAVPVGKIGLSFAEAREALVYDSHRLHHPLLTTEHNDKGSAIAERYGFSFYDSAIVASALLAECKILCSEDLHHQQVIEKRLSVIDPRVKP